MRNRKRHVTLLEILIVLAILGSIVGIIAINIRSSIIEQRYRTEVRFIVDQLRLAQDLMIILNNDVHLIFTQDPSTKKISYRLDLEDTLSKQWKPFILRSHHSLESIRSIKFRELPSNSIQQNNIDLKFLSGGSVMSKGVLELLSEEKESPKTMK